MIQLHQRRWEGGAGRGGGKERIRKGRGAEESGGDEKGGQGRKREERRSRNMRMGKRLANTF